MKKLFLVVTLFMAVFTLAGCKKEKVLTIYFVPSRDAAEILDATEPLKQMLIDELADLGYDYDKVEIFVGSTYEAAAEAMVSGQAEIGFLPGGTYVLYEGDGVLNVALTATRAGLTVDDDDATVWNLNEPIEGDSANQVTFYRGLLIAGPSAKGQELAAKVNDGTGLVWADLEDAVFCVRSASSSSGYIYPLLWLMDNFNKTFADLPSANVIQTSGYGASMSSLANETCDVATFYADARRTYADAWESSDDGGYGREETIWAATDVIGVTAKIYNDTISVATELVDADLLDAIQTAFINIAATTEGKAIIEIYSHEGYKRAVDSDYDSERAAKAAMEN